VLADGATLNSFEQVTFFGGSGADTLDLSGQFAGSNFFDGGQGVDTIVADLSTFSTSINLSGSSLSATGASPIFSSIELMNVTGGSAIDFLSGGIGADTLNGGGGDDFVNGYDGADLLAGGAGSDRIDGGTGADTMLGGAGDDTYYVDDAGDVVTELANEGN